MIKESNKIVAYFDFDGTISDRDTFLSFLKYVLGWKLFLIKLPKLIIVLFNYLIKRINNEQAKQATITITLKNYSYEQINQHAKNFAISKLNKYIKPLIYRKLEWHREQGHTIILISANLAIYLEHWAKLHRIDFVIATELEFSANNLITGKLLSRNCYALQKVIRLKEFLAKKALNFDYSYAYGNSRGDHELLNYADEGFYINGNDITLWAKKQI